MNDENSNSPSLPEATVPPPEAPTAVVTAGEAGSEPITAQEIEVVAASIAETEEGPTPAAPSKKELSGQWYALHVLSAQESKVKESLEKRAQAEEMGEFFQKAVVPSERVSEVKQGKKRQFERKLYPGYVFVNVLLRDTDGQLVEKTWYFIKETPGVIGFADGDKPAPMRQSEVDAMLGQLHDREDRVVPKTAYAVGDKVKVTDGLFANQEGTIELINAETGRMQVLITLFGRSTPVELEYWQVEKVV